MNLSRISVMAAATPQATVAARSGVDMVLWVTGGTPVLGVMWHKSGPPGATLSLPSPWRCQCQCVCSGVSLEFERTRKSKLLVSVGRCDEYYSVCHRGVTGST